MYKIRNRAEAIRSKCYITKVLLSKATLHLITPSMCCQQTQRAQMYDTQVLLNSDLQNNEWGRYVTLKFRSPPVIQALKKKEER